MLRCKSTKGVCCRKGDAMSDEKDEIKGRFAGWTTRCSSSLMVAVPLRCEGARLKLPISEGETVGCACHIPSHHVDRDYNPARQTWKATALHSQPYPRGDLSKGWRLYKLPKLPELIAAGGREETVTGAGYPYRSPVQRSVNNLVLSLLTCFWSFELHLGWAIWSTSCIAYLFSFYFARRVSHAY